ncbi:MAG: efflux RND transporter periplasmic adaptor subunit [Verrucomicrobiales bacterium]|nr:efflux RND transporter periplasmic adaptor subunit [Verrucomicrobiales bacterium]
MNTRPFPILPLALTAALAGAAGWWAASRFHRHPDTSTSRASALPKPGERRILYYQSAMHPWIKSDKPGKCTICGMDLTPVFEGDSGFGVEPGLVTLSSNAISVLHVRTAPVRRGVLHRTLRVAGILEDDATRHRIVSAWTGGRIDALYVNFSGAEITEGQPLARFYSPMLLEAERQYLAVIGGGIPGSATSGPDLLRQAAAQRLRQLGLTELQIEALPSKHATNHFTEILAPAGGTVVESFVYAGQYVMEGEKLFEIADFSNLWFQFDVYEQDLPWIRTGLQVSVTTPSVPGRVFNAPIQFIDPNLKEMTRSAKVRVEIPNPSIEENGSRRRLLQHRLYAEGAVSIDIPDLLLLPRSAVLAADDRPVVYIDKGGGAYEQRSVTLGRVGDTTVEVLHGVATDEPVVVQGNLLLDAQANINQAIHAADDASHAASTPQTGATPTPLTSEQVAAARLVLAIADQLRAALAADDLSAFRAAANEWTTASQRLFQALDDTDPRRHLAQRLAAVTPPSDVPDLRAARRIFHALSVEVVAFAKPLRTSVTEFRDLKIYRCPMTSESFEGAPSKAEWLQLAPPLRNPWFGAEMLECGVEVRD